MNLVCGLVYEWVCGLVVEKGKIGKFECWILMGDLKFFLLFIVCDEWMKFFFSFFYWMLIWFFEGEDCVKV